MDEKKIISKTLGDLVVDVDCDNEVVHKKKVKTFYKICNLSEDSIDNDLLDSIERIEEDIRNKQNSIEALKLKHEIKRITKKHSGSNEDITTFIFRRVSNDNRALFNKIIGKCIEEMTI